MNRAATVSRETRETKILVDLNLDGSGITNISTGIGFFDHLLDSLANHALFDLDVEAVGDLHIDDHHTVEDTMLVLGSALAESLGDRAGISRFGDAAVPMDEAIARCTLDAGGRPYTMLDMAFSTPRIGNMTTQNLPHSIEALARTAGCTIHLSSHGVNDHHIAEAGFKALARSLRTAVAIDERRQGVPSTKGTT